MARGGLCAAHGAGAGAGRSGARGRQSVHDQEQGGWPRRGWTECAPAGAGGPPGRSGKSGRAAAGSPGGAQAGQPGATQGKAPGRALVAADVHGTVVGQAMPRLLSQEPGFTQ